MSLAITFFNTHGIIMSADNLITSTIIKGGSPYTFQSSQTEQKLFLIENKYGLSYTGTSSIDGVPLSSILEMYIKDNPINDMNPEEWLLKLAENTKNISKSYQNVIYILAGYYQHEQLIITTNTINPEVHVNKKQSGLLYSGESNFLQMLIDSDTIAFDYAIFSLQDAADFLRFLNKTVAGLMHFGQYLPTVSENCDLLAILPNESYWLSRLPLR